MRIAGPAIAVAVGYGHLVSPQSVAEVATLAIGLDEEPVGLEGGAMCFKSGLAVSADVEAAWS